MASLTAMSFLSFLLSVKNIVRLLNAVSTDHFNCVVSKSKFNPWSKWKDSTDCARASKLTINFPRISLWLGSIGRVFQYDSASPLCHAIWNWQMHYSCDNFRAHTTVFPDVENQSALKQKFKDSPLSFDSGASLKLLVMMAVHSINAAWMWGAPAPGSHENGRQNVLFTVQYLRLGNDLVVQSCRCSVGLVSFSHKFRKFKAMERQSLIHPTYSSNWNVVFVCPRPFGHVSNIMI